MRRLLAALALALLGAALLPPSPAYACSCVAPPGDIDAPVEGAVFYGEILRRVQGERQKTYVVRVERVYAGEVGRVAEVRTEANGAACGLELPATGTAVFYTDPEGDHFSGSLCSGTRMSTVPPAYLGEGRPPSDGTQDDPPTTWPGRDDPAPVVSAVVAVALGGLLLARRRAA